MKKIAFLALLLLAGCTSTALPPTDVITVEGRISSRGNEPFTALMLTTPQRNYYVLTFGDDERPTFSVSRTYRVTGHLYEGDWNSYAFAHLRVIEVTAVEGG